MLRSHKSLKLKDKPLIIIVDDDQNILNLLNYILTDEFNVETTNEPRKVFDYLNQKQEIAIVISDYHMGPINGISLFEKISDMDNIVRRILITGDQSKNVVISAINKGHIHGFFEKPFEFDEFKNVVKKHYNNYLNIKEEKDLLISSKEQLKSFKNALYKKNYNLFETMKILHQDENNVNIINTLDTKRKKLLDIVNTDKIDDNMIEKFNVEYQKLRTIVTEFDIKELHLLIDYLRYSLAVMRNNFDKISKLENHITNKVEEIKNRKSKEYFEKTYHDIFGKHERLFINDHKQYSLFVLSKIKKLLQVEISHLCGDKEFRIEMRNIDFIKNNLGYILVILDQTTVYTKKVSPKTNISPSLIGSIAIAINEISNEIFTKDSDTIVLDHEFGKLMIYQEVFGLFYVAITYVESYYFRYILKQFAKDTKKLFSTKFNSKSLSKSDLQFLNETFLELMNEQLTSN